MMLQNKLTKEQALNLQCKVEIALGLSENQGELETLKTICKQYPKLKSLIKSRPHYCANEYKICKVEGYISLQEAFNLREKLAKELELFCDLYIKFDRSILLDYNNTEYMFPYI